MKGRGHWDFVGDRGHWDIVGGRGHWDFVGGRQNRGKWDRMVVDLGD